MDNDGEYSECDLECLKRAGWKLRDDGLYEDDEVDHSPQDVKDNKD
jgi:hypothetical protein